MTTFLLIYSPIDSWFLLTYSCGGLSPHVRTSSCPFSSLPEALSGSCSLIILPFHSLHRVDYFWYLLISEYFILYPCYSHKQHSSTQPKKTPKPSFTPPILVCLSRGYLMKAKHRRLDFKRKILPFMKPHLLFLNEFTYRQHNFMNLEGCRVLNVHTKPETSL